jgi:hypothetical protein
LLIFVFAGFSCGRDVPILSEFVPVPNAPYDVVVSTPASLDAGATPAKPAALVNPAAPDPAVPARAETGGPQGPEPTRFGDWERNGRCIDF